MSGSSPPAHQTDKAFLFDTTLRLVTLTGVRDQSLSELYANLADVPLSSIFQQTHMEQPSDELSVLTT